MNYGFVTVKVKNMEESLKFYSEFLGLSIITKFASGPGMTIAFLKDEKGNNIELIEDVNEKDRIASEGISLVSIGFLVDDVEKMVRIVKEKGMKIVKGPIQTPTGVKLMYIEDPNGAEIEFVENFHM